MSGDHPDIDGDVLDRLAAVFADHRGPDDAITSAELADRITGEDTAANPKTREAIRVLVAERGVPIAAGPTGYFQIETLEQFEDYIETLNGRIAGIQERKEIVCEAWNRSSAVPASSVAGSDAR